MLKNIITKKLLFYQKLKNKTIKKKEKLKYKKD